MDANALAASLAHPNPLAAIIAFGVGIASSFGPCGFTSFAWLTATTTSRDTWKGVAVFSVGTIVAYALLGIVGTWLYAIALPISAPLYVGIGVLSIVVGVRSVWNAGKHTHASVSPPRYHFLAGLASGLLIQPCCTPAVVAVLALPSSPLWSGLLLSLFGIGHLVPAIAIPLLRGKVRVPNLDATPALGGLSIAVGLLYLAIA